MAPKPWCRWASAAINAVRLLGLPSHRVRVRQARRVIGTLREMRGEGVAGRCFGYLRQVDPLVFEEVVLCALEDAGAIVLRGRRYSGDGGLDGRFWFPGSAWCWHGVQVKRYGAHISAQHVIDFCQLVERLRLAGGIFVHTGRTGEASWQHVAGARVTLVSGDALVRLLLQARLVVHA